MCLKPFSQSKCVGILACSFLLLLLDCYSAGSDRVTLRYEISLDSSKNSAVIYELSCASCGSNVRSPNPIRFEDMLITIRALCASRIILKFDESEPILESYVVKTLCPKLFDNGNIVIFEKRTPRGVIYQIEQDPSDS